MTLPVGIRGRLVALALLLIPLILLVRFVAWPVAESILSTTDANEQARGEITRYRRLLDQAPALQTAITDLARNNPLSQYLLGGSNKTLAAAGLQKLLQDAATRHGVAILSLRVKNPTLRGPFEQITVEARLRADNNELRDFLYSIETATPYLFVEDLSINVRRTRRRNVNQSELDARLNVYGLRAAEAARVAGVGND